MNANENTSPDAMLDSVAALICEFLVCDENQLTVLTLWVLHTWCYQVSPSTPLSSYPFPRAGMRQDHLSAASQAALLPALDQQRS